MRKKPIKSGETVLSIEKPVLTWLAKVAQSGMGISFREVLGYAAFKTCRGRLAVCATDTHRLHIYYPRIEKGFETWATEILEGRLLDVRRVVAEMSFVRGSELKVLTPDPESGSLYRILYKDKGGFVEAQSKAILDSSDIGTFPNVDRVIFEPKTTPTEIFAINRKYLFEAGGIADSERVIVAQGAIASASKPVMIYPGNFPEHPWEAVVLPMAL